MGVKIAPGEIRPHLNIHINGFPDFFFGLGWDTDHVVSAEFDAPAMQALCNLEQELV